MQPNWITEVYWIQENKEMSRLVGRVHFRIAITSLIIVLFGIGIMVNGICKTLLYYSSPADLCSLREDELSNSRVELSDYSVVWSFNASGYLYYVIEYKTGEYTLVEVKDNSYYSEKIKHHKRNGIDDQEYVINGYFQKLKFDTAKTQLTEKGFDYNQFVGGGMYAIKILEDDRFSIIFGLSVVVLAVGCLIVNYIVEKKNI